MAAADRQNDWQQHILAAEVADNRSHPTAADWNLDAVHQHTRKTVVEVDQDTVAGIHLVLDRDDTMVHHPEDLDHEVADRMRPGAHATVIALEVD